MPDLDYEIVLCDRDPEVCRAWRSVFAGLDPIVRCGDPLLEDAEAFVLPVHRPDSLPSEILAGLNRVLPGVELEVAAWPEGSGGLVFTREDQPLPFVVLTPIAALDSPDVDDRRAYLAMSSALQAIHDHLRLTGVAISEAIFAGPQDSGTEALDVALQMAQAYLDFCAR